MWNLVLSTVGFEAICGVALHLAVAALPHDEAPAEHRLRGVHPGNVDAALRVLDLDGRRVNPLATKGKAVVFIFVSTDCPIANRYAPEIKRLAAFYRERDVALWLVYADRREDVTKIQTHLKEYGYKIAALRDPSHRLVARCHVTKTHEAAVFAPDGREVYRGRIDDRFTGYGKSRSEPQHRDLQEALDAVLARRPVRVA